MHNDSVLWRGPSTITQRRFISRRVQLPSDGPTDAAAAAAAVNEKLFMLRKAAVQMNL